MRVLFIGDSLTLGYLDPAMRGWPGRVTNHCIENDILAPTATLYNLGVRGNAAVEMVKRWQAETAVRLADDTALFIFSFGTADAKQQFPPEKSLAAGRKMLTEAKSLGRVLFLTPPPVTDPEVTARVSKLATAFAKLCKDLSVPCFDLFTKLLASKAYMASLTRSDNVHPDEQGYDLMAGFIVSWDELLGAMHEK